MFAVIAKPSESVSPDATVYENTRDEVPEPLAYVAFLLVRPAKGRTGVPTTVTGSEKMTVRLTTSLVM